MSTAGSQETFEATEPSSFFSPFSLISFLIELTVLFKRVLLSVLAACFRFIFPRARKNIAGCNVLVTGKVFLLSLETGRDQNVESFPDINITSWPGRARILKE